MRRIIIHMVDDILLFTDIWTAGVIQVKDRCSMVDHNNTGEFLYC